MSWIEKGHAFLRESGLADDIAKAHCELIRRHIDELEARAGIPRPCPRCGEHVWPVELDEGNFAVRCYDTKCMYTTGACEQLCDAWAEHERLCREAEEARDEANTKA